MKLACPRILLGVAIAATLGCVPSTDPTPSTTPTGSTSDPLGQLRWRHRPIVAFAAGPTDPRLTELRESILARPREFDDRAMILVTVVADETSVAGRPTTFLADTLRRHFDVEPAEFTAILVGLDGSEKARSDGPVPLEDWFALVDSMPMRRAELRHEPAIPRPRPKAPWAAEARALGRNGVLRQPRRGTLGSRESSSTGGVVSLRVNRAKLTYEHFVLYPDDGMRHEILDGDHYMNPSPSTDHQTISRRIQFALSEPIELAGLGQVFDAPTDVQLSEHDIVVPDLVVILAENRIVTPSRIKGIPDLIVEILSPTNRAHVVQLERLTHERVQVPEYWIVDPEAQELDPLRVVEGRYQSDGATSERVQFAALPNVEVDLTKVG